MQKDKTNDKKMTRNENKMEPEMKTNKRNIDI